MKKRYQACHDAENEEDDSSGPQEAFANQGTWSHNPLKQKGDAGFGKRIGHDAESLDGPGAFND